MIIREAVKNDIPSIITLLKLSLGESLMPKSEEYWKWKHVDNPFGESPVLLALDNEQIVGVRAFMRWEWKDENKILKAVRAVDTATHPDFQGKGIFKQLTLQLLNECKEYGDNFVFNTPNVKSESGYIKMGWLSAGNLPVKISIKHPIEIIKNRFRNQKSTEFLELDHSNAHRFDLNHALTTYRNGFSLNENKIQTNKSPQYISWRYLQIPLIKYYGHASMDGLVIFRLKLSANGRELRVVDHFGNKKITNKLVHEIYKSLPFHFLSAGSIEDMKMPGMIKVKIKGPTVTVRSLKDINIDRLIGFSNWSPSLGDLEVF